MHLQGNGSDAEQVEPHVGDVSVAAPRRAGQRLSRAESSLPVAPAVRRHGLLPRARVAAVRGHVGRPAGAGGPRLPPEPSAPAAPMPADAVFAPIHTVSMTIDEPHDPGRATAGSSRRIPAGARWGTDIGWPQCGRALPDLDVDFVVVQVTSGRPGTVTRACASRWRGQGKPRAINATSCPARPAAGSPPRTAAGPAPRSAPACCAGRCGRCRARAGWCVGRRPGRCGWWLDIEDVPARICGAQTPTPTRRFSSAGATSCAAPARRSGVLHPGLWRRSSGTGRPTCRRWPAVGQAGGTPPGRVRPPVTSLSCSPSG